MTAKARKLTRKARREKGLTNRLKTIWRLIAAIIGAIGVLWSIWPKPETSVEGPSNPQMEATSILKLKNGSVFFPFKDVTASITVNKMTSASNNISARNNVSTFTLGDIRADDDRQINLGRGTMIGYPLKEADLTVTIQYKYLTVPFSNAVHLRGETNFDGHLRYYKVQ